MSDDSWWIYRTDRAAPDPNAIAKLGEPPPWRSFKPAPDAARTFIPRSEEAEVVNTAMMLRRPLLVTGRPGCGKTSLARSIAWQLGLGEVLVWPIATRTSLTDGLYRYDAIARLQDTRADAPPRDISNYLSLGPLGEALAPSARPRVLLIDEIDKSDIDLPNDLLHVFEEGWFEIPELRRMRRDAGVRIGARRWRGDAVLDLPDGVVRCTNFPIVVMTSNGERDFPAAFLRRCVQLHMGEPDAERLRDIVEAHLGAVDRVALDALIKTFVERKSKGTLATDQLLNAMYLAARGVAVHEREALCNAVFEALSQA